MCVYSDTSQCVTPARLLAVLYGLPHFTLSGTVQQRMIQWMVALPGAIPATKPR